MKKVKIKIISITRKPAFNPQMGDIFFASDDELVGLVDFTNDSKFLSLWVSEPELDYSNVFHFGKIISIVAANGTINTKAGTFKLEVLHEKEMGSHH